MVFINIPCAHEKIIVLSKVGCGILYLSIKSSLLIMIFDILHLFCFVLFLLLFP